MNRERRKRLIPTIVTTFFLWSGVGLSVIFLPPYNDFAIPLVLLLVFLASFFTGSLLFQKKVWGLLLAMATTGFLIVRLFGIGNLTWFLASLGILLILVGSIKRHRD